MLKQIYKHQVLRRFQRAAASLAARRAGLRAFEVPGSNMEPTLARGHTALYEPIEGQPRRGDIVAFTARETAGSLVPSRVIALEGDTVEIREGELLLNGLRVAEPYLQPARAEQDYSRNTDSVVVPRGHVWLMGDFRDMSKDSRSLGPLPIASLLGRVTQAHAPGEQSRPYRVNEA